MYKVEVLVAIALLLTATYSVAPCPAGQADDVNGNCVACTAGQFSPGGTTACAACSSTCSTCDNTNGNCNSCTAGSAPSGTSCTACPAGQFSAGTAACAACSSTCATC